MKTDATRESCIIASANTPHKLQKALESLRKHAPELDPVVLHATKPPHDPAVKEVSSKFDALYFVSPKNILSKRWPGARHGGSLDWYMKKKRPGGAHVWFMDSDTILLSDRAITEARKLATPLCGVWHTRQGGYTYARPAWMAVNIDWLFSHEPPWCVLSKATRPRHVGDTKPGDEKRGFDTCELLTIWCRLEGLPVGMLRSTNDLHYGQKHAKYGVDGIDLLYHECCGTSRVRWGNEIDKMEWPDE
jgi:hypothetical protein